MNIERETERDAARVMRSILEAGIGAGAAVRTTMTPAAPGHDVIVEAAAGKMPLRFAIEAKSRVTPEAVLSLGARPARLPKGTIPVIYAPVISPRVAELLRERGIGYADRAGNCWLHSDRPALHIERQGFKGERQRTPAAADLFSPRSSRIVRALLSNPRAGWQVRQLAQHPDVDVSPGLVVKVKRALIEEGYAVERQRRLYVRDAVGLLNAWSVKYKGPAERMAFYFRGDPATAEEAVSHWCRDQSLQYVLAGFSAAWRLAPEVRYTMATLYVEDSGFEQLQELAVKQGAKRVDSGANLQLWRPYDHSVFAGCREVEGGSLPVASPLQTYLDVKSSAGRGAEAAQAVFDKHLKRELEAAARPAEE